MKKLLLLLMIIPMIGFGQRDSSDFQSCYHVYYSEEPYTPVQLIDLLACAARHKNSDFLDILQNLHEELKSMDLYSDDGTANLTCEHLEEFSMFLIKGPTSNRDIKTLNRYISSWSNIEADYVSPMIPFGGKEYIKVSLYDRTRNDEGLDIGDTGRTLLFTNGERGSNYWMVIMHPERLQKAVHKFFKKEKNWHFDKYPKK